jgi:protein-disulfide isomerase/uncharacterized membrane protein
MSPRSRAVIVLILALLGAFLSLSLLAVHHGEGSALEALCGETSGPSGCDVVNSSAYASIAGIPLAAIGLAFYLSLALLVGIGALAGEETLSATAAIAFWLVAAALLADAALLAVQAFVLHAFCNLCLLTYGVSVAALAVLFPARKQAAAIGTSASTSVGKAVLVSWIAGTLAFGVAAKSIDDAKAARASERQGKMLGTPGAVSSPSPAVSGPEGYRLEAMRLQGILDDPQKLQQYLDDKAAKEYAEEKVQAFDLAGVPVKGPAAAPVTAVEFSDFLCPHCRSLAGALDQYLPQSGDRVKIVFKQYPLESKCNSAIKRDFHPGSCMLALGGICAAQQGKFWQYHDKVFAAPPTNPGKADVVKIAKDAGLDGAALETCLASPAAAQRLSKEIQEGQTAGVVGTPAIYLQGKKLPRLNDFGNVVEQEAAKKGMPAPKRCLSLPGSPAAAASGRRRSAGPR